MSDIVCVRSDIIVVYFMKPKLTIGFIRYIDTLGYTLPINEILILQKKKYIFIKK